MQLLQPEFGVSEDRYLNADYLRHYAGGKTVYGRSCKRVVDRTVRHTVNRNVVLALLVLLLVLLVYNAVASVVRVVTDAAEAPPWLCAKFLSTLIDSPIAKI